MNLIAVGSLNPVKVGAVASVIQRIWPQARVDGVAVDSGVSAQPMKDDEAIEGARTRARLARTQMGADLGLGLEGYTIDMPQGMFVSAWVVAVAITEQGDEAVGLGASGRFLLPERVARAVRAGAELGPLMDQFVDQHNTKQRQGAVGILTDGLVQRKEALEVGVLFALTRFIVPHHYRNIT